MKPTTETASIRPASQTRMRAAVRWPAMAEVCHAPSDLWEELGEPAASSGRTASASYRRSVPESSIVVRPEPIESGSYTASSRLQAAGLPGAIKLFEDAAEAVPLPRPPQPIVI